MSLPTRLLTAGQETWLQIVLLRTFGSMKVGLFLLNEKSKGVFKENQQDILMQLVA